MVEGEPATTKRVWCEAWGVSTTLKRSDSVLLTVTTVEPAPTSRDDMGEIDMEASVSSCPLAPQPGGQAKNMHQLAKRTVLPRTHVIAAVRTIRRGDEEEEDDDDHRLQERH